MHYLNTYGKWLGVQRLEQRENEGLLRPEGVGVSSSGFSIALKCFFTGGCTWLYTSESMNPFLKNQIRA